SVPDLSAGQARANVDAAQTRVHKTSVALQTVTLDAFESSLDRRAGSILLQRGVSLAAALLTLVAVAALAWLCVYGRGQAREQSIMEPDRLPVDGGPRGYQQQQQQQRTGDVMNARDLLHPELVRAGGGDQTLRRRERP